MRIKFILFFLLSCCSVSISQPSQDSPNILWIVSEDNSPFIGAYGDEFATTPNIDQLAAEGVLYEHAFAPAPVCSPARSTLITGVYATSMGTQHMRSKYPIPDQIRFFPEYLKKAGYYTTNNSKTDYNTSSEKERMDITWDESSTRAHYKNRQDGQPFFAVFNITTTHESSIFEYEDTLSHDPEKVEIPPYLPDTPEMKHDWAHYYDNIKEMDAQVGQLLEELDNAGLSENTIVFYFSDHGGILGRSKQYLYDSGLQVPLIIRFPKKYQHLASGPAGTKTDRLVSFVDFAPTLLSLAGLPIPEYMEGKAFLGEQESPPREYIYSFRGRMDERNDMVRGIRDKNYFYRKNYMPHRIYGQHIQYHWRAPSIRSWERAYDNHELNKTESKFWEEKPPEELYNVEADPHQIHNLAKDPEYRSILKRMRNVQKKWSVKYRDVGFIPEGMIEGLSQRTTMYEYGRRSDYPVKQINNTVEKVIEGNVSAISGNLHDGNPILRYWAAIGCIILKEHSVQFKEDLKILLEDPEIDVRIAAAEALYNLGETKNALNTLIDILNKKSIINTVHAMDVLEIMGDDAKPALDDVTEILNSDKVSTYEIRAAAERLVKKLNNK